MGLGLEAWKIYLICGVSGSGKTWVCKQLQDKFHYVPHDEHFKNHPRACWDACQVNTRPIITECPFGERVFKEWQEKRGITVLPFFIVEPAEVCAARYREREGKEITGSALTRAQTIRARAYEWDAPFGTSTEILGILRRLNV